MFQLQPLRRVLPETFSLKTSDIRGVTEVLQPMQQPSNPLPLWSITAGERVIVPPHSSVGWRSNNMHRILHQRASSPERLGASDDVGTESYRPSGPARPSSRKPWSFRAGPGAADH